MISPPALWMRRYAAGALGLLELAGVEAAPALARTKVEDPSLEVRQTAAFAPEKLGPTARQTTRPMPQPLGTGTVDEAVRTRASELLRDLEKR